MSIGGPDGGASESLMARFRPSFKMNATWLRRRYSLTAFSGLGSGHRRSALGVEWRVSKPMHRRGQEPLALKRENALNAVKDVQGGRKSRVDVESQAAGLSR